MEAALDLRRFLDIPKTSRIDQPFANEQIHFNVHELSMVSENNDHVCDGERIVLTNNLNAPAHKHVRESGHVWIHYEHSSRYHRIQPLYYPDRRALPQVADIGFVGKAETSDCRVRQTVASGQDAIHDPLRLAVIDLTGGLDKRGLVRRRVD